MTKWIDCDKANQTLEQILRKMIYEDAEGNPALHTNSEGTALQPWFDCDRGSKMTLQQTLRLMILVDGDGNPYLNTTS